MVKSSPQMQNRVVDRKGTPVKCTKMKKGCAKPFLFWGRRSYMQMYILVIVVVFVLKCYYDEIFIFFFKPFFSKM